MSTPAPLPSPPAQPTRPVFDAAAIQDLCVRYRPLTPQERLQQLFEDFPRERIMLTSSFAATSAMLLHLYSRATQRPTVHFIDTGYHFAETLDYKALLARLYGLDVIDVRAETWKHEFTQTDKTWEHDPDFCCSINKVEPLEAIKDNYWVWISGLMRWQTGHRATLDLFEERGGILKFYPLIDVTREQRDAYIREHQLPFHPLVARGYCSIGCQQCTVPGEDRSGRWNNKPKTECGLHL